MSTEAHEKNSLKNNDKKNDKDDSQDNDKSKEKGEEDDFEVNKSMKLYYHDFTDQIQSN